MKSSGKKPTTEEAKKPKRYDHTLGAKAKRSRQNQRTFQNVQRRRRKHDRAHGYDEGTTNSHSRRWVLQPTAK